MAKGGWRIHFEPTILFVSRTGPAAYAARVVSPTAPAAKPPPGTPGVVRVRLRITDDGKGSPPVAPGAAPIAATLQFVSRISGTSAFTPLGEAVGQIAYVNSGSADLPKFTCRTRKVPGTTASVETDFTPATTDEVARSDWVLRLEPHPDHFDLAVPGSTLALRLAWLFNQTTPELQLTARLLVGTTVVADEAVNPQLKIPLMHPTFEEDFQTAGEQLTLFGVRTVMPASLTRPPIAIGTRRFHVFLDPSVTTFIDSDVGTGQSGAVRNLLRTVLRDLGIATPDIVMTGDPTFAAEQTRWATLVNRTNGKFHCLNISNLTTVPANSAPDAQTFLPNRKFSIPGDGSRITFFDFFVGLESTDPPTTELGLGEMQSTPNPFDANAATKLLLAPIVLFGGSRSAGIRSNLAKVDTADRANFMANVILHEIGHALGLRHGARIDDTAGYSDKDGDGVTNSLLFPTAVVQPNTGTGSTNPCRLNFFGPVQRNAVRARYSIP
jgi:hypothetical protein